MKTVEYEDSDVRITRDSEAGKHHLSILKDIYVEFGTKDDWENLSELHYKGKTLASGARFLRCVHEYDGTQTPIGVIVFANPMPLNRGRNDVFPRLRPNQEGTRDSTLINKRRMKWINTYLSWNNRTVLDTMYRSAGIAYRFKNLAYRMYCNKYGYRFIESSSSMGKFNPFSIKSGMKFIKPRPNNALEDGIAFFRTYFKSHPCDQVAMVEEFKAMPKDIANVIDRKIRQFYFTNSAMEKTGEKMHLGMTRIDRLPFERILKEVLQLVFSSTIYWVFESPDFGREEKLPAKIPLLAFDNQAPNEPLDLRKLNQYA